MSKRTTSSVASINIKDLSAADRLHGSVRFRYTLDGKPVEHTVYLMQTDCHYGGVRYWFGCKYCQRRVGVLYLSGGQCACRHCFKLAYKSERETKHDRLFRKAGKIRARLGWQPGIAFPDGAKPKGMHWKAFNRMKAEHDITVQRICGITAQLCNTSAGRLQAGRVYNRRGTESHCRRLKETDDERINPAVIWLKRFKVSEKNPPKRVKCCNQEMIKRSSHI